MIVTTTADMPTLQELLDNHEVITAVLQLPPPDVQASVTPGSDDLDLPQRFEELADQWSRETEFISVHSKAILQRPYQRIIALGPAVVPLLLERLRDQPDHWFWALSVLTDEDPAEQATNFSEARQAWLDWGLANGYIDL